MPGNDPNSNPPLRLPPISQRPDTSPYVEKDKYKKGLKEKKVASLDRKPPPEAIGNLPKSFRGLGKRVDRKVDMSQASLVFEDLASSEPTKSKPKISQASLILEDLKGYDKAPKSDRLSQASLVLDNILESFGKRKLQKTHDFMRWSYESKTFEKLRNSQEQKISEWRSRSRDIGKMDSGKLKETTQIKLEEKMNNKTGDKEFAGDTVSTKNLDNTIRSTRKFCGAWKQPLPPIRKCTSDNLDTTPVFIEESLNICNEDQEITKF